ncbi:hypothetical protein MalM25_21720 [Planctomycetes bacterium MalM25]|nr:hypothetical protein MalM25_21720 [Planctomycetes bacterium MalM25]
MSHRLFARRLPVIGLIGLTCICLGCQRSPFEFAPAAGVVTLDGEPLANARVTLGPQRQGDSLVAGPDSSGVTDAEGRFILTALSGETGAVVGSHKVRISTLRTEFREGSEAAVMTSPERVPRKYRSRERFTATVPSGGREDLLFELTSD